MVEIRAACLADHSSAKRRPAAFRSALLARLSAACRSGNLAFFSSKKRPGGQKQKVFAGGGGGEKRGGKGPRGSFYLKIKPRFIAWSSHIRFWCFTSPSRSVEPRLASPKQNDRPPTALSDP